MYTYNDVLYKLEYQVYTHPECHDTYMSNHMPNKRINNRLVVSYPLIPLCHANVKPLPGMALAWDDALPASPTFH